MGRIAKICVWVFGLPVLLLLAGYFVLLATPVKLPFGSSAARAMAVAALPPTSDLQLGEMWLALESGIWPVIRFSPVVLTDTKSGARMEMGALEVGFSPMQALFGQPGATVTMVAPHIQIVQDLFGPRATNFQIDTDDKGFPSTVRVLEGDEAFPSVDIAAGGITVLGQRSLPADGKLRSDNDWLIYNLEASEQGVAQIVDQVAQGRFSRLVIRDGVVEMNDTVYGLFRRFDKIGLTIAPSADRQSTEGTFTAALGGRTMSGTMARTIDAAGAARLEADVANIDFASFLPFIDDPNSLLALRGAGALSIDVNFAPATGKLLGGGFKIDLTGLDMRIKAASFPIASSILDIAWTPADGRFTLADSALRIGRSSAHVSGSFAMGLDPKFGPTLGISLKARDVAIVPDDMEPPMAPIDSISFTGWSAALYGALGIDRLLATKGAGRIEATGRVDMLRAGLGLDMTLTGQGISADDVKRLWPFVAGGDSRDVFVASVTGGMVQNATMRFNFPVGSLALGDADRPIPKGSLQIDMVGTGVAVKPVAAMVPIALDGETRLRVRDADVTISADGGSLPTAAGAINVSKAALVMDNSVPSESVAEISGDLTGSIPAILALLKAQQPDLLAGAKLPVTLEALSGSVNMGLVSTIRLARANTPMHYDYVLNGTVSGFGSSQAIRNHRIGSGNFSFSASQQGYQVAGTARIDGTDAEIGIKGVGTGEPEVKLASTLDISDLAAVGFDASEFLSGKVRFAAQLMPDGTLQIVADLKDAALSINDLALTKATGVPGLLKAVVKQNGSLTDLRQIDLGFGTVHLVGDLVYDADKGLQSADFSQFALSEGDNAQVALVPIAGGYGLTVRGAQLDLKPLLKRFFGLGDGAGGVESTQFKQTLSLDIRLDRALGSYATTAFNLVANLLLKGSDLRKASLAAQFGTDNGISITTNPAPDGRTMSVIFNDAGTVLRLLGVYSQLAGGDGTLVLNTFTNQNVQAGELRMRNFSIVNEDNVRQILGNHSDSRSAIAKQNRLDFTKGEVKFTRRSDRIELTEALVSSDTVGGTARGFIYTDQRQYDLTGTYVPLFGLNNVFQKIPLLGPILGGRNGEGLVGVTFQVKGPLDQPQFRINPLSALVPGAFRELFEFRATEQPRVVE